MYTTYLDSLSYALLEMFTKDNVTGQWPHSIQARYYIQHTGYTSFNTLFLYLGSATAVGFFLQV